MKRTNLTSSNYGNSRDRNAPAISTTRAPNTFDWITSRRMDEIEEYPGRQRIDRVRVRTKMAAH
jgi:hypothetical protein